MPRKPRKLRASRSRLSRRNASEDRYSAEKLEEAFSLEDGQGVAFSRSISRDAVKEAQQKFKEQQGNLTAQTRDVKNDLKKAKREKSEKAQLRGSTENTYYIIDDPVRLGDNGYEVFGNTLEGVAYNVTLRTSNAQIGRTISWDNLTARTRPFKIESSVVKKPESMTARDFIDQALGGTDLAAKFPGVYNRLWEAETEKGGDQFAVEARVLNEMIRRGHVNSLAPGNAETLNLQTFAKAVTDRLSPGYTDFTIYPPPKNIMEYGPPDDSKEYTPPRKSVRGYVQIIDTAQTESLLAFAKKRDPGTHPDKKSLIKAILRANGEIQGAFNRRKRGVKAEIVVIAQRTRAVGDKSRQKVRKAGTYTFVRKGTSQDPTYLLKGAGPLYVKITEKNGGTKIVVMGYRGALDSRLSKLTADDDTGQAARNPYYNLVPSTYVEPYSAERYAPEGDEQPYADPSAGTMLMFNAVDAAAKATQRFLGTASDLRNLLTNWSAYYDTPRRSRSRGYTDLQQSSKYLGGCASLVTFKIPSAGKNENPIFREIRAHQAKARSYLGYTVKSFSELFLEARRVQQARKIRGKKGRAPADYSVFSLSDSSDLFERSAFATERVEELVRGIEGAMGEAIESFDASGLSALNPERSVGSMVFVEDLLRKDDKLRNLEDRKSALDQMRRSASASILAARRAKNHEAENKAELLFKQTEYPLKVTIAAIAELKAQQKERIFSDKERRARATKFEKALSYSARESANKQSIDQGLLNVWGLISKSLTVRQVAPRAVEHRYPNLDAIANAFKFDRVTRQEKKDLSLSAILLYNFARPPGNVSGAVHSFLNVLASCIYTQKIQDYDFGVNPGIRRSQEYLDLKVKGKLWQNVRRGSVEPEAKIAATAYLRTVKQSIEFLTNALNIPVQVRDYEEKRPAAASFTNSQYPILTSLITYFYRREVCFYKMWEGQAVDPSFFATPKPDPTSMAILTLGALGGLFTPAVSNYVEPLPSGNAADSAILSSYLEQTVAQIRGLVGIPDFRQMAGRKRAAVNTITMYTFNPLAFAYVQHRGSKVDGFPASVRQGINDLGNYGMFLKLVREALNYARVTEDLDQSYSIGQQVVYAVNSYLSDTRNRDIKYRYSPLLQVYPDVESGDDELFSDAAAELKDRAASALSLAGRIQGSGNQLSGVTGFKTYGMPRSLEGLELDVSAEEIEKKISEGGGAFTLAGVQDIIGVLAKVTHVYFLAMVRPKEQEKVTMEVTHRGTTKKDSALAWDKKVSDLTKKARAIQGKRILKGSERRKPLTEKQMAAKQTIENEIAVLLFQLLPVELAAIIKSAKDPFAQTGLSSKAPRKADDEPLNRTAYTAQTRREAIKVLNGALEFLEHAVTKATKAATTGKRIRLPEVFMGEIALPYMDSLAYLYMTQQSPEDFFEPLGPMSIGGGISTDPVRGGESLEAAAEKYAEYGAALRKVNRLIISQSKMNGWVPPDQSKK